MHALVPLRLEAKMDWYSIKEGVDEISIAEPVRATNTTHLDLVRDCVDTQHIEGKRKVGGKSNRGRVDGLEAKLLDGHRIR